MQETLLSNYFS